MCKKLFLILQGKPELIIFFSLDTLSQAQLYEDYIVWYKTTTKYIVFREMSTLHLGPFLFHIGLGFASDRHDKTDPRAPKCLPRSTISGQKIKQIMNL
jgi:hypothetical protein